MIINGDCVEEMKKMKSSSIDVCITSPPYFGLRDYGVEGQIGMENSPDEYVKKLADVFFEVYRLLKPSGSLWLNLGDSYSTHSSASKKHPHNFHDANTSTQNGIGVLKKKTKGIPEKNLLGIPWRVALELQQRKWILRNDIIWHKPNPMPGGQGKAFDRFTVSHEYLFMLTKQQHYYFNGEEVRQDNGARPKDVWTITTKPFKGAHFAVFPVDLVKPCILAGCPRNGVILDPFSGSGTVGVVAKDMNRDFVGIELNQSYCDIAQKRIEGVGV